MTQVIIRERIKIRKEKLQINTRT